MLHDTIERLKTDHKESLRRLTDEHGDTIAQMKEKHAKQVDELKALNEEVKGVVTYANAFSYNSLMVIVVCPVPAHYGKLCNFWSKFNTCTTLLMIQHNYACTMYLLDL